MFDFDKVTNRRGTNSLKWDVGENELPLWVADMDFPTAPAIVNAVKARAESGIYGYNIIPPEWNQAISNWWQTRHGYTIDPDSLIFAYTKLVCKANVRSAFGDRNAVTKWQ